MSVNISELWVGVGQGIFLLALPICQAIDAKALKYCFNQNVWVAIGQNKKHHGNLSGAFLPKSLFGQHSRQDWRLARRSAGTRPSSLAISYLAALMPRPATPNRPRVTRRHYAEQLDWWAASGWVLELEEGNGWLYLHTHKQKTRGGSISWGATATPEEVSTPELTRSFLTAALYLHLHPRKALAAHAATGQVCTQREFSAFIRAQRRKVGAATLGKA